MKTRALVIVCLAVGLLAFPANTVAQEQPPSPAPSPAPPADAPTSPFDIGGRIRSAISEWFGDLVASALGPVFDLMGRTVFSTPAIDENPRVRELWGFSLSVANAALIVFLLAGASFVTVAGGTETRLGAKELLPRTLVAALTANLSWMALREMTTMSNALSRGVFGTIDPQQVGRRMAEMLFSGSWLNPFLAILALAVVVLGVLVLVTYVVRVAVLVVLAAAAPLMLITHTLPQSDQWARMWWRATLALLAAPVAQSFLAAAAFRIFLSGDGLLGFSSGGIIDLLVIGSILYLLFKIPIWALNVALGGAVSSAVNRAKTWASRTVKAAVAL